MGMRRGKVLTSGKKTARRARKAAPARRRTAAKPARRQAAAAAVVDRNRPLRDLAQRIIDVTLANDDEATFKLYADTVESKEANNPASVGLDAIREKFAMWRNMVTDAVFTPVAVTVDNNTIMIEWEGRVTLAASGRVAEMREVAVHEIDGGKIVRERFYYDPSVLQP